MLQARWSDLSEAERAQTIQVIQEAVESRDIVPSAARELEEIAQQHYVNAASAEALRDFMSYGAMSIIPSIMLQHNAGFN